MLVGETTNPPMAETEKNWGLEKKIMCVFFSVTRHMTILVLDRHISTEIDVADYQNLL